MSHVTYIKFNGEEHKILTEQYDIGLYVIEDNDSSKQYGVDEEEIEFHKKLRDHFEWDKEKSSVL